MTERTVILVIGVKGLLGSAFPGLWADRAAVWGMDLGPADGAVPAGCEEYRETNLGDAAAMAALLAELKPRWVVNCAAYTDVDGCEDHWERAVAVNAEGPGHLARLCRELGAGLVHFSTEYVFDGRGESPYREDDPHHPLSSYGLSKSLGEHNVIASGCEHIIARPQWLYGPGKGFVPWVIGAAEAGRPITVVNDQWGAPTLASDLAESVVRLMATDFRGMINLANSGFASRWQVARAALDLAGLDGYEIRSCTTAEWGPRAPRPLNCRMNGERARSLGVAPRSWEEALAAFVADRAARRRAGGA